MGFLWLPAQASPSQGRNAEFVSTKATAQVLLTLPESHGKQPLAGSELKPLLVPLFAHRFLMDDFRPAIRTRQELCRERLPGAGRASLVGTVELRI